LGAIVQRGLQPGSGGIAIVRNRYLAITSEDTVGSKDLACDLRSVEMGDGAIINCSYESCVKVVNKSNMQSQTTPIVAPYYMTIY
jgi:hypothetical protein